MVDAAPEPTYEENMRVTPFAIKVWGHKLQCMFEEYAKDNYFTCFDVHSCQCFRDTI